MNKILVRCFTALGMLLLIFDGRTALGAASSGLDLCIRTVIPSLFPFFFLGNILLSSLIDVNNRLLFAICRIFRTPIASAPILLTGVLGGYPTGAQALGEARKNGILSANAAGKMLAFCNNAGPSFLFGMISTLFSSAVMPWMLWLIHLFSAWLVSLSFPVEEETVKKKAILPCSPALALEKALRSIALVCGWVILFRVLIAFLDRYFLWMLPDWARILLIGILEMTNGCLELSQIESIPLRFLLCSVFLSLGGLCVTMQTASSAPNLSLRWYLPGKLLQCLFSIVLSLAFLFRAWYLLLGGAVYVVIRLEKIRKKAGFPSSVPV